MRIFRCKCVILGVICVFLGVILPNFPGGMLPDPSTMVVLKLICDVTRLWRNFAPPSEIFCVRHCLYEFLFFLFTPLVFTVQKYLPLQWSFGLRQTTGPTNLRLYLVLIVHQCNVLCKVYTQYEVPKICLDHPASLWSKQTKHTLWNRWLLSCYAIVCIQRKCRRKRLVDLNYASWWCIHNQDSCKNYRIKNLQNPIWNIVS